MTNMTSGLVARAESMKMKGLSDEHDMTSDLVARAELMKTKALSDVHDVRLSGYG